MAEPMGAPEFSDCVIYDRGDHVELKWTVHGHRRLVLVAEEIIEEMVAKENELRHLRGGSYG